MRWDTAPLGLVADLRPSSVDKLTKEDEVPVQLCNYTDVYYADAVTSDRDFMHATATHEEVRRFTLQRDDVALTKDSETPDDIGIPTWIAEDLPGVVLGYHTSLVRPRGVNGRFLFYVLSAQTTKAYFEQVARGVTRFALRQQDVASTPVPVPPLETQRRIADYLDTEIARIDTLIAKNGQLDALSRERFVRAVIESALGEPMRWGFRARYPMAPAHAVALVGTGHTPSRSVSEYWIDCTIPWVNIPDLVDARSLEVDYVATTAEHLSELGLANSAAVLCPAGTLFVTRTASIGHAVLGAVPMATNQSLVSYQPDPQHLLPEFLLWGVRGLKLVGYFDSRTFGATHDTIYYPDMVALPVPVPDIQTQQAVIDHLSEARADHFELVRRLRTSSRLLGERRQALITAAVTGEIEV